MSANRELYGARVGLKGAFSVNLIIKYLLNYNQLYKFVVYTKRIPITIILNKLKMKKIYTIIAAIAVTFAANAQTRASHSLPHMRPAPSVALNASRVATGDSLFFFDGNGFYGTGISATSTPPFAFANDDVDGKQVAAAFAGSAFDPMSAFVFFYDVNSVTGDTNSFAGATSWFNPAGQADNWLSFGPIAIPAAGAVLSWKHNMPDGNFRDGYKVFVSTTGESNYTDFTTPAIYTITDNDATTAGDTVNSPDNVFVQRYTDISAYAGQSIFIGFQHNANDQFILYLDDVVVTEGPLGVAENQMNGVKVWQNAPNPANDITAVDYELQQSANVVLNVYDVTGKKVAQQVEGNVTAGKHVVKINTTDIASGVYYYSLQVGSGNTASMKMVVVK
jgi:hypothetical protein